MTGNKTAFALGTFLLLFGACGLMVLGSLYSNDGNLSQDSTNYLKAAESILAGNGTLVSNPGRNIAGATHFAVWPIGYPVLISSIAAALNISSFLASKILNILLMLGSSAVIWRVFGPHGMALSLVMCFGAALKIFSYTWSETAFIFFLICFAATLVRIYKDLPRANNLSIALLLCLGLLAFLSRYIGAFVVIFIFLLSIQSLKAGDKKNALKLGVAGLSMSIFVFAYLYYNKITTGYPTGMQRIPAPETNIELLKLLFGGLVREAIFPLPEWNWKDPLHNAVVLAQILLLATAALATKMKAPRSITPIGFDPLSCGFMMVGAAYLATIIFMRWRSHFDGFNIRLLHPGVILMLLGALNMLLNSLPGRTSYIKLFIAAMATLAVALQAYSIFSGAQRGNYQIATAERIKRYENVPPGSIVIFADIHLNYLRPDLHTTYPDYRPYSIDDEPWNNFISQLDKSTKIFVDISDRAKIKGRYHDSVKDFVRRHDHETVFELNNELDSALNGPR